MGLYAGYSLEQCTGNTLGVKATITDVVTYYLNRTTYEFSIAGMLREIFAVSSHRIFSLPRTKKKMKTKYIQRESRRQKRERDRTTCIMERLVPHGLALSLSTVQYGGWKSGTGIFSDSGDSMFF